MHRLRVSLPLRLMRTFLVASTLQRLDRCLPSHTHTTTTNNNKLFSRKVAPFLCANSENSFKLLTMAGVDSAAARRRQRRLGQFVRLERLSVAMVLAESQHHTSRGQKVARAGEEGHEEHDAFRRQRPPPPQASFRLFDEEDSELGARPGSVTDPVPQGQVGAAHRGAQDRGVPVRSDPRCSCAADGRSGGGSAAEDRRGVSCGACAGCRRAQDLFGPHPTAFGGTSYEDGGAVGGSADGARMRTCGRCQESPGVEGSSGTGRADRSHSSSSWSSWSGWSSRFPTWTGFNSVLWSRLRRKPGSAQWRSSRFSPERGFKCFIRALAC